MPKPMQRDFFFEMRLGKWWLIKRAASHFFPMAINLVQVFLPVIIVGFFGKELLDKYLQKMFEDFEQDRIKSIFIFLMVIILIGITIWKGVHFLFHPVYKAVALSPQGIAFDLRWGKGVLGSEWEHIRVVKCNMYDATLDILGEKIKVRCSEHEKKEWWKFYIILRRQLGERFSVPARNRKMNRLLKMNVTTVFRRIKNWVVNFFNKKETL